MSMSAQGAPVDDKKPDAETHFGFLVDLEGVELDENDPGTARWIQAFPIGKWKHPTYGDIEMTLDRAVNMAANVNAGVRGQDLDIDYDHKEYRADAAGWVQQAEARSDGLWLNVEWTREAFQKLKDKAYKYFSPEFANVWEHTATGRKFKDVLFGGALTNRPHLKGILPINLSEFVKEEKSSARSTLEVLAAIYSVKFTESTTDDELKTNLMHVLKPLPPVTATPKSVETKDDNETAGMMFTELSEEKWDHYPVVSTD